LEINQNLKIEQSDLNSFAVLLLVLSGESSIADRTQIQKKTFIVNECGWNAITDYIFIGRGPFSKWVDLQLDALKDAGIVDETEESALIGTDNEVGFYCYSLTTKGKSVAKSVLDSINNQKLVDDTLKLLFALSKYTEEELELVSAILYVSRDKNLDFDGIVQAVHSFRPQFSEELVRKYLDKFNRTRSITAAS